MGNVRFGKPIYEMRSDPLMERSDGWDGFDVRRCDRRLLGDYVCIGNRLRETGGTHMSTFYLIGAVVSAGLMVYLVIALLNAEEF